MQPAVTEQKDLTGRYAPRVLFTGDIDQDCNASDRIESYVVWDPSGGVGIITNNSDDSYQLHYRAYFATQDSYVELNHPYIKKYKTDKTTTTIISNQLSIVMKGPTFHTKDGLTIETSDDGAMIRGKLADHFIIGCFRVFNLKDLSLSPIMCQADNDNIPLDELDNIFK